MTVDVIIPVLNEEHSIVNVLNDIPQHLVRNIYVVDNGSTDRTKEFATDHGAIVLTETRRGYGSACLKGIQFIVENKQTTVPDAIAFLDGDYSDYPEEIEQLIQVLEIENMDMVIGSRVLGLSQPGSLTAVQKFGNALSTVLIKYLFGYHFTDLGPFRIIRFDRLMQLNMTDPDYGWTVEMQIKAAKLKLKVKEVPVSYRNRIGISKVSGTVRGVIGAGSKILYTIFKSFVKP